MKEFSGNIIISNVVITNDKGGRRLLSTMKRTWDISSEDLVNSFIEGKDLKHCFFCGSPVIYLGEYNGIAVYRCVLCLEYYNIHEYNMLEG